MELLQVEEEEEDVHAQILEAEMSRRRDLDERSIDYYIEAYNDNMHSARYQLMKSKRLRFCLCIYVVYSYPSTTASITLRS